MSLDFFLGEVREQPALLSRVASDLGATIRGWRGQHEGSRWHLAGCGDMHFAARIAAGFLARDGVFCRAHRAMDLRWVASRLGSEDVVVVASVSGRTPRALEAALLARSTQSRRVLSVWRSSITPRSSWSAQECV